MREREIKDVKSEGDGVYVVRIFSSFIYRYLCICNSRFPTQHVLLAYCWKHYHTSGEQSLLWHFIMKAVKMLISFPGLRFVLTSWLWKAELTEKSTYFVVIALLGKEKKRKERQNNNPIFTPQKYWQQHQTDDKSIRANLWFWDCHVFSIMQFHFLLWVAAVITSPLFFPLSPFSFLLHYYYYYFHLSVSL